MLDQVWYNSGEYSGTSGTFICPVSGVYVFSYNIAVPESVYAYVDLVKDSSVIGTVHVPPISGRRSNGAGSVVVSCSQYSEVMLKYAEGPGQVYGGHYTQFSGFLLHQTS